MSLVTQKGDLLLNKDYWENTPALKWVLVGPTYVPNRDHQFADQITAHELTGTGYVGGFGLSGRKAIANPAATSDDANNRNLFAADAPAWPGIDAGEAAYICLVEEITNDAASPLLMVLDAPTTRVTDGGDLNPAFPETFVLERTT